MTRIRPDYRRIPLGDNLRPTVAPPSELGTLLLMGVCVVVVVLVVVLG